jgi:hypothetical protein
MARDEGSGDVFLALFNLQDEPSEIHFDLELAMLRGAYQVRDLWKRRSEGRVEGKITRSLPAHGSVLLRLSE